MTSIPGWPLDSTGLTPADVPADYNVFPDIWNDGMGFEPIVVGRETNDAGREVILISLSPGHVISATLISGGDDQVRAAIDAVKALAAQGRSPLPAAPQTPPGGSPAVTEGEQRGEQ